MADVVVAVVKNTTMVAALVKVFLVHDSRFIVLRKTEISQTETGWGNAGFKHIVYDYIGPHCLQLE